MKKKSLKILFLTLMFGGCSIIFEDDLSEETILVNIPIDGTVSQDSLQLFWWETLEAKPTISRLMQMAEEIRQKQLTITLKKLPPLNTEQEQNLDAMTKAIVKKILHNPIEYLKKNGHTNEEVVRVLRELFALDEHKNDK